MNRAFSKRQKKIMALVSGNKCMNCGKKLNKGFHGDHKIPFSKGGKTILSNAQSLCPECNLRKGSNFE